MEIMKLGDVISLKSHPYYSELENVLIASDPTFTPPLMVISESLKPKSKHSEETGETEFRQVKGLFYSYKTGKYEQYWFKESEVKLIHTTLEERINYKSKSLKDLRDEFLFKQVVLHSVDLELGKMKISTEFKNLDTLSLKKNPLLSFLPPVMHIIDVRLRVVNNNYSKHTGEPKSTFSEFEFKCKWSNPFTSSFSEEWLPSDSLRIISTDLGEELRKELAKMIGSHFLLPKVANESDFKSEHVEQLQTVLKVKNIVFNHYFYQFITEELFTSKLITLGVNSFIESNPIPILLDSMFTDVVPNYSLSKYKVTVDDFKKGCFYEIVYFSDRNITTKRFIYIIDIALEYTKLEKTDELDSLLIANCLLRNGDIRHFKVSNIKSCKKVKEEIAAQLFKEI